MSNTANATKLNHRYNDLDELRGAVRKAEQHLTWMLQGYLNAEGAEETLQDCLSEVLAQAKGYLKGVENAAEEAVEDAVEAPKTNKTKTSKSTKTKTTKAK